MTVSHRRRGPAADHVEHARRRRGDEAARDAGARRHGVVAAARADRHAGHLLLAAGAAPGTAARATADTETRAPCRGSPSSRLSPWSLPLPWRSRRVAGADATAAARRAGSATARSCRQVRAGDLQIALLSPTGTLHQGRNTFTIEFRSADGDLVTSARARERQHGDAGHGHVRRSPGACGPQSPGRYEATAEFGMAGAWHMAIEWDGPAGQGSVNFEGAVQ